MLCDSFFLVLKIVLTKVYKIFSVLIMVISYNKNLCDTIKKVLYTRSVKCGCAWKATCDDDIISKWLSSVKAFVTSSILLWSVTITTLVCYDRILIRLEIIYCQVAISILSTGNTQKMWCKLLNLILVRHKNILN